jgi:hypothetical protein
MAESSLAEGGKIGGIKIPGPQSNTYQASADTVSKAIQKQTSMRGHNVFRPDIYRVSEGYIT